MTSHGTFHWNELMTHDVERSKTFYGNSLDWTFSPMPMEDGGTYWLVNGKDVPLGGLFEMKGDHFNGVPEHWMPYIAVDDVDARLEKALANGAEILRPAFDVPDIGRIAMLKDSGGAVLGWMTPAGGTD